MRLLTAALWACLGAEALYVCMRFHQHSPSLVAVNVERNSLLTRSFGCCCWSYNTLIA